jgi:tetratricopeptide (TPR) repeat protein
VSGNDPIIRAELALTLEIGGKSERAMDIANEAIEQSPRNLAISIFYAKMCLSRGMASIAMRTIETAIDTEPNNPEAWRLLAIAANSRGTIPVPLKFANTCIKLQPKDPQSHTTLATAHRLNGDIDKALVCYDQAMSINPSFPEAIAGKAEVLESIGRTEEAEILLTNSPSTDSVVVALAKVRIARKLNKPDRALQAIDSVMNQQLSPYHLSNLNMHRGRVLEELSRYDDAWNAWEEGNKLHSGKFPLSDHIKLVDTIIDSCSKRVPDTVLDTVPGTTPIFIVGMFRSGTTLLEQILGAHQKIDVAGEVDEIVRLVNEKQYPECISKPNAEWQKQYIDRLGSENNFCTDKMPMNYLHIGLIHTLFPNAIILHTTRNPLDTCVSCFANAFSASHSYTSHLKDLAGVYEQYQRVMSHWNSVFPELIYEVPYESLVENLERTVQGVLNHIGVEFEPACLEFYNVRRIAVTPSADQVRKPIYATSVGRHKHFAQHLEELNCLQ